MFIFQAQKSDSQKHTFMQFHDAFNSKSVSLTCKYLYSEHNDLRLYLVAVKLTVGFCQNKPYKANPIKNMQHVQQQERKKKKQVWLWKRLIHAWNLTHSSTGVCHGRTLTRVDSHGGKDAVAFLLKTVFLQELKGG